MRIDTLLSVYATGATFVNAFSSRRLFTPLNPLLLVVVLPQLPSVSHCSCNCSWQVDDALAIGEELDKCIQSGLATLGTLAAS